MPADPGDDPRPAVAPGRSRARHGNGRGALVRRSGPGWCSARSPADRRRQVRPGDGRSDRRVLRPEAIRPRPCPRFTCRSPITRPPPTIRHPAADAALLTFMPELLVQDADLLQPAELIAAGESTSHTARRNAHHRLREKIHQLQRQPSPTSRPGARRRCRGRTQPTAPGNQNETVFCWRESAFCLFPEDDAREHLRPAPRMRPEEKRERRGEGGGRRKEERMKAHILVVIFSLKARAIGVVLQWVALVLRVGVHASIAGYRLSSPGFSRFQRTTSRLDGRSPCLPSPLSSLLLLPLPFSFCPCRG